MYLQKLVLVASNRRTARAAAPSDKAGRMRMLLKLVALAVLTVLFQLSIEVCVALTSYPTDPTAGYFGCEQTEAVLAAERRFRHCSRLSRWIVKDLIAMPLAEPLVSSVGLPPTH